MEADITLSVHVLGSKYECHTQLHKSIHKQSPSAQWLHHKASLQCKVVIELMLNYCMITMMTHLQYYLFMALTLAMHAL